MACTAASDLTRRANEALYNESVDIADQHLSDFRVQVTRLGGDEDPDFTKRCADVEAGLASAITRLRRGPTLDRPWHEFAQRLVTLAERVNTAAADGAPDYYKTRVQEVAPITERALGTETADTLANPDTFALRRFSVQSRVIGHLRQTAALAIATVRDDVDRVLAIPYFTIDRFLLRIMGQPKGAIA
jgi:hypothetical protein